MVDDEIVDCLNRDSVATDVRDARSIVLLGLAQDPESVKGCGGGTWESGNDPTGGVGRDKMVSEPLPLFCESIDGEGLPFGSSVRIVRGQRGTRYLG